MLHSFEGIDGGTPLSGPTVASDGNLYGTTSAGGSNGWGTVYQLNRSDANWTETVLHNFEGGNDGIIPSADVVVDAEGNLFGVTQSGGYAGGGNAFELAHLAGGWDITTLLAFPGSTPAGSFRTLVMDTSGDLYGTTAADGVHQRGSIFKLARTGSGWIYQSLHEFTGDADGAYPYGTLFVDTLGNIFGTASAGGAYGNGVIFEITP